MSRASLARSLSLCLILAGAVALAACGGPAPTPPHTPTAKPPAHPTLSSTLVSTPSAPGISPSLVATPGQPGKPGIVTTMVQPPLAATPAAPAAPVSFSRDIAPIIRQNCSLCHIDQSMGGLSLEDYSSRVKGGQSGSAVVPGRPETS